MKRRSLAKQRVVYPSAQIWPSVKNTRVPARKSSVARGISLSQKSFMRPRACSSDDGGILDCEPAGRAR